jgi:rhamnosyltransferase
MQISSAPNRGNTCAVIVTFFPDENLISLVETINKEIDYVFIIDNTDSEYYCEIIQTIKNKNVLIFKNNANLGIAKALNQGFKLAKEYNFEWVITFDQDTILLDNYLQLIKKIYTIYPSKSSIGAIGLSSFVNEKSNNNLNYIITDYLITSGCIIPMSVYNEVGDFIDDLFIDNVDIEYSLRIRHSKFKLIKILQFSMIHKAGNSISKKLLFFNFNSSNHNSFRRFYMSRNHILLVRKYATLYPLFILKASFFFCISIITFILFEKNVKIKLHNTLRGIKEGIKYNLNF